MAGTPTLLRQMNLQTVLSVIRAHGPLSRSDLRKRAGLSRPTINEVLADLFERGWIVDEEGPEDPGQARPGPRPRLLRFRAELGGLVGIDVGAAKALIHVCDLAGEVKASVRLNARGIAVEDLFTRIGTGIKDALRQAHLATADIQAAVLSTPGVVSPETGRITLAPQLDDWAGRAPGPEIAKLLGCPVEVENEMLLAVLGERWKGAAQGLDDVAYLGIGVGVGAGLLIDGKLHRGRGGTSGEIGYLPIPEPSPSAVRIGLGPLEQAAGAGGLIARGRALAEARDGTLRRLAGGDPGRVDERIIFEAAREGDQDALGLVDTVVEPLARAIATLALVTAPEMIIIGGGLSGGAETLLVPLRERVDALLPISAPLLVLSTLGDRAAAVGAICRAVEIGAERLLEGGNAA